MATKPAPVFADAGTVAVTGIQIPGSTPEGIEAQLLNIDFARGVVATIIHLKAGAEIPAHFYENGSEAHYVLQGDLVDGGRSYGPGAYLTHAAGVVHGPHSSVEGCRVLTVQGARVGAGDLDFHVVEGSSPGDVARDLPTGSSHTGVPPDMDLEPVPADESLETQRVAPTDDNPTNPATG